MPSDRSGSLSEQPSMPSAVRSMQADVHSIRSDGRSMRPEARSIQSALHSIPDDDRNSAAGAAIGSPETCFNLSEAGSCVPELVTATPETRCSAAGPVLNASVGRMNLSGQLCGGSKVNSISSGNKTGPPATARVASGRKCEGAGGWVGASEGRLGWWG